MKKRVLILSANPKSTSVLDLGIEKKAIRQALNGTPFEPEPRDAVTPEDLHLALLEVQTHVVHFCGHGEGTEVIVLMDDVGKVKFASTSAFPNLFKLFQDIIECIVLNACYTEVQATAVSQHINYCPSSNF